MQDLVVAPLLGPSSRSVQGANQVVLGDRFDIVSPGERALQESLSVKIRERLRIGDEPSLDRLHHKMTMFNGKLPRIPSVPIPEMLPRGMGHQRFGVDKQDKKGIRVIFDCPPEGVEGGIPASTHRKGPASSVCSGQITKRLEKIVEAFADGSFRIAPVPSTLHVDSDLTHHRFPPISPIRQSSPSRYLSSQIRSFSGSRRRRCVPWSSRSQTTTASGTSESLETSVSECVVTMS